MIVINRFTVKLNLIVGKSIKYRPVLQQDTEFDQFLNNKIY